MTYQLGIDLGTTFSTAAVLRDGRVEVLTLGTRSSAVPTVVFVRDDGAVLVGEAAEARGVGEPDRLAREFKRRLGDPTPLVLGGAPYGAERLAAYVLEHIVVRASERMGGPPDSVVVTHPASYSAYRLDLLREATVLAGCRDAVLLPEPQAAAWHYAHDHRIERDETIAVFDFGGGTLDTAVVRAVPGGFELLGEPQGLDRFGGIDIDDAVFEHVREQVDDLFPERDEQMAEPAWRSALARLRIECRTAKERLSDDVETVIAVVTPAGSQQVPLRRWQLEAMVRPRVGDAVRALERAIESAGLTMTDVSRVLLVGGTSRIPLVRVMLAEATGRQIALDADPETTIALGAARWNPRLTEPRLPPPPVGAPAADAPPPPPPTASPSPSPSSPVSPVVAGPADEPARRQLPPTIPPEPDSPGGPPTMRPDGVPIAPHAASTAGPTRTRTRPSRRRRYVIGGVVAAVAAVGVGIAVTRSGDEPADPVAELSAACTELADATADAVLPTTVDEAREFSGDFGPAFDRALERIEPIGFTDETDAVNHQLLVESLRALGQSVDLLGDATVDDVVVYATDVASGTDNVNDITSDFGVRGDCIPRSLADAPAAAATTVPPTELPTTVPVTTAAPTTVAPTTVPPTELPTTVPVTAVAGVIQAVDLGQFFVGPDGLSLAPFEGDTLQTNVVDSWQTDPAAGPALSFIYGARILDGTGVEVGQAFVFVGNQQLADTPAGTRIVNEFVTAPAAVTTEPYTSGVFPGTLFTLQSGTNGWVSPLGNSVTLVFGTGDQVRGLVDGFVAANVGRSLPGLP